MMSLPSDENHMDSKTAWSKMLLKESITKRVYTSATFNPKDPRSQKDFSLRQTNQSLPRSSSGCVPGIALTKTYRKYPVENRTPLNKPRDKCWGWWVFPFPLPCHKPFFPAFYLQQYSLQQQQARHRLLNYKKKGKAQGTPPNSCASRGLLCRQVVCTFSPNLISKAN